MVHSLELHTKTEPYLAAEFATVDAETMLKLTIAALEWGCSFQINCF